MCNYYSGLLRVNGSTLISNVVNGVFTTVLNASNPLLRYFNGTYPAGSFDFTKNATAYNTLFAHLVQFFGKALNCTDGSIAAYAGADITLVHANMGIGYYDHASFNQALLNVLTTAGVFSSDVTLVATLLDSLRPSICTKADCSSICNKYSSPGVTSNYGLVSTVVSRTVTAAFTPGSGLDQFFNGSVPAGSTNYVGNTTATVILAGKLVSFFGGALGCSDGSIQVYGGPALAVSHAKIPINNASFVKFNTVLVGVLAGLGVSSADQTTVAGVLEGTRSMLCNQVDCFAQTGTAATGTSAAGTSASPTSAAVTGTTAPSAASFLAPIFYLATVLALFLSVM